MVNRYVIKGKIATSPLLPITSPREFLAMTIWSNRSPGAGDSHIIWSNDLVEKHRKREVEGILTSPATPIYLPALIFAYSHSTVIARSGWWCGDAVCDEAISLSNPFNFCADGYVGLSLLSLATTCHPTSVTAKNHL